ncbi:hypothetical protein CAI21_20500 [Alkalilimnicola ehrlichii]|uniref:DUF2491 domain-containing protein n=1 Tax=Alkalilimnicola ehrlichii TaxID=351052 RepID=A0A3E0WTW8_9GAMM|nr:DUF2491 family protein [Alkalilimnicola ehrlichii]RFA24733.1 hypothetical protein CAI21_20500 [Alkalilimnicola ehrlichii]RFA35435.1 hypothetical protein CAL65_13240 [Alkalilimnicola ehrlichii]
MLGFFKKAYRARKEEQQRSGEAEASAQAPYGLRLSGFVELDGLPFQLNKGEFVFSPPAGSQRIDARGAVDLGAGCLLHRFYLTDDAFVQVNTTAGNVDDLKFFVFDDTKTPSNAESFAQWLGEESVIGRETIEHRGKTFFRVWGDEGQQKAPPVTFDEEVFTGSDSVPEYTVSHFCMLYEREVEGAERLEYLLVSAEQTGEEYCVVFSVGVDVSEADLDIV